MNKRETGFFKDFKVTKYAKQIMAAIIALAVLAAVVIGIFGFNLAYQYKGGYRITVQIEDGRSAGAVLADYKKSVVDTVEGLKDTDGEEYGLKILSVSVDRIDIAGIKRSNLILTAKHLEDKDKWDRPLTEAFMIDFKNALDLNGYKTEGGVTISVNVVGVDYNAPATFADVFFNPLAFVLLAGALICVYFAFRYNLKEAAVTACVLLADILLFIALLALARVPLDGGVTALLALTMIESLFGLAILFGRIKTDREAAGYTGFSDAALAEAAFRESFKKLLLVAGVSALAALAVLIGTADSMVFGASAFIAVLCGAANAIFFAPALYALLKKDKPVKAKAAVATGSAKSAAKESKPYYVRQEEIRAEREAQSKAETVSAPEEELPEEEAAAEDVLEEQQPSAEEETEKEPKNLE